MTDEQAKEIIRRLEERRLLCWKTSKQHEQEGNLMSYERCRAKAYEAEMAIEIIKEVTGYDK